MRLLVIFILSLKALITTKIVCFCRLIICYRNLFNKHYRLRSSGSTLFVSILTLVNNVSKYTQQTTLADIVFRCIFAGALRVNALSINKYLTCLIQRLLPFFFFLGGGGKFVICAETFEP